jgi:cation transport ATPase
VSTGTDLDERRVTAPPAPTALPGAGGGPADRAGATDPGALRRHFTVSAALTVPVLLLSWFPLLQFPHWPWVVLALAVPVVGWGALPLHRAALARLREGSASPDTLASVAVLVALGASVAALLTSVPGVGQAVPLVALGSGGAGRLHLDAATALTTAQLGARLLGRAAATDGDRRPPWSVPAVLLLAVAAGGFWAGAGAGRPGAVAIALAVLVAACPVALVLAEPAAVLAAARAARWRGAVGVTPAVLGPVRRVTTVLLGAGALTGGPRPDAVARLRGLDLDPVLLTTDGADAARALAARSGIDTEAVAAGLPPHEQVAAVLRLQRAGCVVAVVGGPGDGPVLAAADVGLALEPGPGDVVLPTPDLDAAVDVLELGRRTGAVVRTGEAWALAVAVPGTGLAAAGLLHPSAAVAAVALGAALVAVRSLTGFHGAGPHGPDPSLPAG